MHGAPEKGVTAAQTSTGGADVFDYYNPNSYCDEKGARVDINQNGEIVDLVVLAGRPQSVPGTKQTIELVMNGVNPQILIYFELLGVLVQKSISTPISAPMKSGIVSWMKPVPTP